jgi:hypothetical protein
MASPFTPSSARERSRAASSGASGVVKPVATVRFPRRRPRVPSAAPLPNASSRTAAVRKDVVVLPFVPVMPTTASSADGSP